MTLSEIISGGGIGLLAILTLIQIAPIKINPWSMIAGWFTKPMQEKLAPVQEKLADVQNQLTAIDGRVEKLSADMETQSAIAARSRILRFGDELLHGVKHSKDMFDSIMGDCMAYEKHCAKHPDFKNGITEPTIKRINDVYDDCLRKGSFT